MIVGYCCQNQAKTGLPVWAKWVEQDAFLCILNTLESGTLMSAMSTMNSLDGRQGGVSSLVREPSAPIHLRMADDQLSSQPMTDTATLPKTQSGSESIDRMAAGIRLQRFLGSGGMGPTPHNSPWPSRPNSLTGPSRPNSLTDSLTDISQDLECRDSLPGSDDTPLAADGAAQHSHLWVLKRTISDAALEALESVESLKCPVIEYCQLQIKRKIGDGSIGQVFTLSIFCVTLPTGLDFPTRQHHYFVTFHMSQREDKQLYDLPA